MEDIISKIKELGILIVEDDLVTAHAITVAFQRKGLKNISVAKNSKEAFKHISNNNISLILLDINLKDGDSGIEIANEIAKLNYIPTIFMTGSTDEKSFNEALASYPVNIIIKPIDFRQLVNSAICALNVIR